LIDVIRIAPSVLRLAAGSAVFEGGAKARAANIAAIRADAQTAAGQLAA
jgi:hypothetical protein